MRVKQRAPLPKGHSGPRGMGLLPDCASNGIQHGVQAGKDVRFGATQARKPEARELVL